MFSTITKAAFIGRSPCTRRHWNTIWTASYNFLKQLSPVYGWGLESYRGERTCSSSPASQWQNHPRTESKPLTTRLCLLNKAGMLHSVTKLCLALCNPMDYSPPSSSVHGLLQTRILEWVAGPSSRGSSWPSDWTCISYVSPTGRQVPYH